MSARASVLVVDDEPGMREMLCYELAQDGYQVEAAESGMAAVAAVKRRRYDVVLTDLKMPGMDGVATVEALRAVDPDLEVIVATGYATVETAVACMKRGAYDYIQKPFELDELKMLLDRAVERSHLQGVVALYEASRALLGTLDRNELARVVVDIAGKALRADDATLLLWRDGGTSTVRSHAALVPDAVVGELCRHASRAGPPVELPSAAEPALALPTGVGAALLYPLPGRHECAGVLALFRAHGSSLYAASERHRGQVIANQLALALDNARLFEELEARVLELAATREDLARTEKLALAGSFAGAIAHEINNPLAAVRVNLDALRDYSSALGSLWLAAKGAAAYLRSVGGPVACAHADGLLDATAPDATDALVGDVAAVIDECLDGVRRIADLVAGFRFLADPPAPGAADRFALGVLVAECAAALRSDRAHAADIVHEVDADCCVIAARRDVRHAVVELLSFLCEQSVSGPVRVRVARGPLSGVVELEHDALALTATERLRIFDPKMAVDEAAGRTIRLDLRLALAHHLLARNGARVEVDATARGGLRVRISLPAGEA